MHNLSKKPILASVIIGLLFISLVLRFFSLDESKDVSGASGITSVSKPAVALLSIIGPIRGSNASDFVPSGIEGIRFSLEKLAKNKSVKALVLRINSPGGTVGASQELFEAVMQFRENTKKPVVVSILDVGASGAYWVALAADKIIANPGSMVGSLGVITQSLDLSQIQERYGINTRTFKAGEHKDLLNPWREMSGEEEEIIQEMLDDVHAQFIDQLRQSRGLSKKRAARVADGRIFTGRQAIKAGLVDELGSLSYAINQAAKMGGIKGKPRVLSPPSNPFNQFFSSIKNQFKIGWVDALGFSSPLEIK